MSENILVEPDVGFIKEVTKLGGQDLKKCFQCATCSVACTISPDNKPFPRKEMLAASWGLKDRLVGNGDIWLCHNCGDCSTRCPRGAKPGDVLAAIRAYAVTEYATPRFLGKWVNDPSKLPILLAIPVVIFLVVGLLLKMVGIDWLNFAPAGENLWQSDYVNNYLVDIIMVPTFFAAIGIFALGLKRFLGDMHANAVQEGKTDKKSIEPVGFVRALIRTLPNIAKHSQFEQCGANKSRTTAHMMVLFGFLGLLVVTGAFFTAEWVLHIEGPYSQLNPFKWLGNVAGLSLLIGGGIMVAKRMNQKDQVTSYKDWYLLGLVLMLAGTGLLTQMLRLGGMYGTMAIVYWLHLIFIWALFAYTPFSKLAHLAYRTTAMAYNEYAERK
jgi:quinone-modifying oxidoreductase, subunit QmoC